MEGTPDDPGYRPGRTGPGGPPPAPDPGRMPPPQGPPPGYPQQQGYDPRQQGYAPPYGGQHEGPGFSERASDVAATVGRNIRTPETKPFYMTSEFLVWFVCVLGVVIAGAVVGNGDHGDTLRANTVWILITVISFGYIISRGISKAGTKYRNDDHHDGYTSRY
jgi:hypothetical protein